MIFWEAVALSSSHLCRPVAKNLSVGWGLLWAAVLGVNQGPRLAGPPTVVSGLWRPAHQAL